MCISSFQEKKYKIILICAKIITKSTSKSPHQMMLQCMDNMIYFDYYVYQVNFANFHWKHNKNGYKIV